MLALDRGGTCKGVVQRPPPGTVEANLDRLLRREMPLPSPFPPRWLNVQTSAGPLRAITFAIDRNSDAYVGGLSVEETANALAEAAVRRLEELGIDDRLLWRLQEMIAERIEAAT